jgi:hypothetical protein
MIGGSSKRPDTIRRIARSPEPTKLPSPCHPSPLFPLLGEREEGEGSWGEGSCRDYGSLGNANTGMLNSYCLPGGAGELPAG